MQKIRVEDTLSRSSGDVPPDDAIQEFLDLLNELKATGCNLLVVGDEPRCTFTRASKRLFGDAEAMRYRLLAVTDATPQSVADRLPDAESTPRPVEETTHVLTHAQTPRCVTTSEISDSQRELASVRETRIADPELCGLQSALVEGIETFADATPRLRPGDLRVGIDSLGSLLDEYDQAVVRRCLDTVGRHVCKYDGMAHYVLPEAYDSDRVQSLLGAFDAVIEVRRVSDEYEHDAEERWHVPDEGLTIGWTPL
ncbi:DUF7504 family protein [Halorussus halophilus]|uniref:DUF7504 family protein n=1 Tax=Halorussus halophilus TaxID=2650975 RepID=UPI00130189DD|nr:hypothetical protein [Halorussus halophilus]